MSADLDALPGDPVAVRQAAHEYESVADAIRTAAGRLRQIADQRGEHSEAVAAVATKARDVSHQVSRAHGRYQQVGRALGAYALRLDTAQSAAAAAVRAGRSAADELATATRQVVAARAALEVASTDELAPRTRELDDALSAQNAAQNRLDVAYADLHRARTVRDDAAERAATTIRAALDDGLDDGWWQDWGKDVCTAFAAVADLISNVVGMLAILLIWVPGLGEVLALIAVCAAAIKLLADLPLVLDGAVNWGDVGWDVVAIVPGGVGRSVGTMARTTAAAARGTARNEAERLARKSITNRPPKVARQERDALRRDLAGGRNGRMCAGRAEDMVGAVSGRQALRDGLDVFGWKAIGTGRELRGGRSLRELWQAGPGQRVTVRMTGDHELAGHLGALREIAPELTAQSPATAKALARALRWRTADNAVQGYVSVEAFAGGQDVADAIAGDDYRPGIWHAYESVGAITGADADARRVLHLDGAGR